MSTSIRTTSSRSLPLLIAALVVAVAGMALQLARSPVTPLNWPLYDYAAFYAAGRLNLAGEDPYDTAQLEIVQRAADPRHGDTLVMWPAPWALTLLMPFCGLSAGLSHLLWLTLQLAVLVLAVGGTWLVCGGRTEDVWRGGLLALAFLPTHCVLVTGQFGLLILLGLVGFLYFLRQGRDAWAGVALVLTAIKPQLTLLFWVALLLWAVNRRRWRLVAGGLVGAAALLAWPLWQNPSLPIHYWHALTQRTQTHSHLSPVLGTGLRLVFGVDRFWLQFVPTIPGLAWVAWYWRRHRRDWDWQQRLPALLFASFLTASYGAWPFDLVVLLLPLLQLTVRLQAAPVRTIALAATWFALVNLLALTQLMAEVQYFCFVWMTPTLWAGYVLVDRGLPKATMSMTGPVSLDRAAVRPAITS
jgi:hypothetical protein